MARKKLRPDTDEVLAQLRDIMGPWGEEQSVEERDYWACLNHLSRWITENYGPRCPETSGGCGCCQAWAVYDLARAVFMEPD